MFLNLLNYAKQQTKKIIELQQNWSINFVYNSQQVILFIRKCSKKKQNSEHCEGIQVSEMK